MPSVEYFAHWVQHTPITIEAHEHFQKRSWRNRTAILSSGSPLFLTIPLAKGKHEGMPIASVRIAYHESWTKSHLHAIQTAYGKTPFAEEILPGLDSIFASKPELLWELNLNILAYFISLLGGKWEYQFSDGYVVRPAENTVDLRRGVPAGTTSLKPELLPLYPQVQRLGKSFQANLSILDVLCHLGPETNQYLALYAAVLYP